MTAWRLALRTLTHQWRLAVLSAFCVAIATSVIVGSLTVGDSVRGSLERRLVDPLGSVRYALQCQGSVASARAAAGASACLHLNGSASNQAELTAGDVTIWGVDGAFRTLFPNGPALPDDGSAWVTAALAAQLGLRKGDMVFLSLPKLAEAPLQSVFAKRSPAQSTVEVVATVGGILPDAGLGRFGLEAKFQPLKSVFVRRGWLAGRLGKPGAANLFLGATPRLTSGFALADDGLHLVAAKNAGGWVLQSDDLVLREDEIAAAKRAASEAGVGACEVSIALATTIRSESRSAAYAMVAWVDGVPPSVNAWAAEDLAFKPGGRISADLMVAKPDGEYGAARAGAAIGKPLPMAGVGAEPAFVPALEGVTDAKRIDKWDPPFEIDRNRITLRDEAYWDRYRAAPRLFLDREQVKRAWGGASGVTGVWITGGAKTALEAGIASGIFGAGTARWTPRDVRKEALAAARGSTDMATLMLALGAFVLAGAVGLSVAVFSLAARQETRTYALLAALGIPRYLITRTAHLQGASIAVAGTALGVPGSVGFAWAALAAMRALMPGDYGFQAMRLYVASGSLLGGSLAAAAVGAGALVWAARKVGQTDAVRVLRGGVVQSPSRAGRISAAIWFGSAVIASALAPTQGGAERGLLLGAAVLCAAIGSLSYALASEFAAVGGLDQSTLVFRQIKLAAPSFLVGASLSALATFVICAVAGHVKIASSNDSRLLVSTALPVGIDFSSEEGRRRLGLTSAELASSKGTSVLAFLRSPGDDVSCLNPAKPTRPRYLGVSPAVAKLRPFRADPPNAWERFLTPTPGNELAPAIADSDTVTWTFESAVGGSFAWHGDRKARFVGVLADAGLAREVLIPEADLRAAFPAIQTPSFFVVTPSKGKERFVAGALTRSLALLGPEIRSIRDEIAELHGVQNAYIGMFLALGALGLALGVVGAAFVGLREAHAHRSRFAILRALGMRRAYVVFLAVAPGAMSSVLGVLIGALACAVGSPRDFALVPVATVVASVLLVLAFVNVAIGRRWRKDVLVQELRTE